MPRRPEKAIQGHHSFDAKALASSQTPDIREGIPRHVVQSGSLSRKGVFAGVLWPCDIRDNEV